MKKLILISLVIFFAICSKSWAGEVDRKALFCGNDIYYFNWGDVNLMGLEYGKKAKIIKKQSHWYKADSDYIYFFMKDANYRIDRESLALIIEVGSKVPSECSIDYFDFEDDAKYKEEQCEIKKHKIKEESKKNPFKIISYCEVSNWKEIKKHFQPEIDRYNNKIKNKEKKNKI